MDPAPHAPDWAPLLALLGPIHDDARRFARYVAGSNAEGDDLFHDAVLRARAKLDGLEDRARFRAWFHQIVISVHRSRARRAFWRRLVSDQAPEGLAAVARAGVDGGTADGAGATRAAAALATLPAVQREAIVLHELMGHGVEEIAALQRTSVSSVKSRLSRGRERLRRHYGVAERAVPRALSPEGDTP
jgi:RNA polymerase sigma-70 factor (ECF subfamily)